MGFHTTENQGEMMSNSRQNYVESKVGLHLGRNFRVYATIVGLLWIVVGCFTAYSTCSYVSEHGLGRYATGFGLSRLPGYDSVTDDDRVLFGAMITGATLLVSAGLLVPFGIRLAIYAGIAGGLLLALLRLMALLQSPNIGLVLFHVAGPAFLAFAGLILHIAYLERNRS